MIKENKFERRSPMTGREIQDKITDPKGFALPALNFEQAIKAEKPLEFETPELALEFLSLFAVLLMTNETGYQYDNDQLLSTYKLAKSKLSKYHQIASSDFLSNPKDIYYLVLWGKLCFVRS